MSNLVTFEQAKQLKELWFDLNTRHVYTPYTNEEQRFWRLEDGYICYREIEKIWNRNSTHQYSAPTVSEALDWIREEKGIECCVFFDYELFGNLDNAKAIFYIKYGSNGNVIYNSHNTDYNSFDTHPLASSALLTEVLNYLMEKEK